MLKTAQREAVIGKLVLSLQAERLKQSLSLNEVATRSGLNRTMISRVEKRERTPTIDTLLRITDVLAVDLGELIQQAVKDARRR